MFERFWTHFWIWALNGVLYLENNLHQHGNQPEGQRGSINFKKPWWYKLLWGSELDYLLLISDPNIIRLSSMLAMISDVLSPLRRSSPLVLKLANVKVLLSHSAITCFSFCSISRSFTALMQISCGETNRNSKMHRAMGKRKKSINYLLSTAGYRGNRTFSFHVPFLLQFFILSLFFF